MSNLDKYVEQITEYAKQKPDLTETELVMYVYLDLGKKFKFEPEYFFGNSKNREKIYRSSARTEDLEKCFDSNNIICRSSSRILEYVLSKLGVNIKSVIDETDEIRLKHVFNVVYPKDGSSPYRLDLQRDLMYIRFNQFPRKFGLSPNDEKSYIISPQEQKLIHKRLGYVTKDNPYTDEYIYNFKLDLDYFDNFFDKVDFVMDNIEPKDFPNVGYWERRWNHEEFLSRIFPFSERTRIQAAEFYKLNSEGKKEYINGFYVEGGPRKKSVYIFSEEESKYEVYSLEEYLKKAKKEGIHTHQEALKEGKSK